MSFWKENTELNEVILNAMQKDPLAWLYEVQAIMKETDGQVLPDNVYFIKVVFGLPNYWHRSVSDKRNRQDVV